MLPRKPLPAVTLAAILALNLPAVLAEINGTFVVDDWNNFNSDPDVWGSVAIPGPRLDRPYPGKWDEQPAPEDGWRLDIAITAQLIDPEHGRNLTLLTAKFRPPPAGRPGAVLDAQSGNWSVPSNISSTWRLSLVSLIRANADKDFRDVSDPNDAAQGACPESVVSKKCVEELRERIASREDVLDGRGVVNVVPRDSGTEEDIMPTSGSCNEFFDDYWATWVELNNDFNKTSLDWYPPWATTREGQDLGAYDAIGRKMYPVIMVWGHSNTTEVGQRLPLDHVTVACIKADNLKPGSQWPKGAAGSLRSRVWAVGFSAAAVSVLTGFLF